MTRSTPMAISVSMREIYFIPDIYIYIFPGDFFFFFFVVPFRIDAQSREKVIASSKNVEFQPRRC